MSSSIAISPPAALPPISVPHALRWLCFAILTVGCFFGPIDIAEGTSAEASARVVKVPAVMVKLANSGAAGMVGLWGCLCLPAARRYLLSIPGLMLCAVALIFLVTSATSISLATSIPICLIFIAYLLFVPTALASLTFRQFIAAVLLSCTLFTLGAVFLYIFVPRIGVFVEEFNDGVAVERLGGMSQPNHVGRTATLGLLLCMYFIRVIKRTDYRIGLLMLTGMFTIAAILAMSRTALMGMLICMVILNLDLLFTRIGVVLSGLIPVGLIGILVLMLAAGKEDALAKKLLGSLTKTGELQEVTQVTGRYEIWERAVQLIKGRPLQGYGLGSNKVMLKDHLQSTHNVLLHPTLAAGVFAGGLTLLLLSWNLINVLTYPNLLVRALSAYIIISGFTEDTLYETFPGPCTVLWVVCCLLPAVSLSREVETPREM